MPTNPQTPYLPDPTITLNDLLNPPAAGPNSTPEMDAYYDQGRREALLHVLATGQAPLSERVIPHGPIGAIAQRFGFSPMYQPLPQSVADQVQLAQGIRTNDLAKQQLAQKLATLQAIQPGVIQLGPEYGQSAAKSLGEPDLTSAFPSTLKGRGQIAEETQQMKDDVRNKITAMQEALDAGKQDLLRAQIENLHSEMSSRDAALSAREEQDALGRKEFDWKKEQAAAAPVQRAQEMHLQSLDRQEQAIYSELSRLSDPLSGAPLPDTDPRVSRLEQRLQAIQDERDSLYGTLTGAAPAKPTGAAPKPAAAADTKKSKIPGLFGD